MKSALFLCTCLLSATVAFAKATPLDRDIKAAGLDRYEKAGRSVSLQLRRNLVQILNSADETTAADRFERAYQEKQRPGALETLSLESRRNHVAVFIDDVHRALDLRQKYAVSFRQDPKVRARIQNILIGTLHVLDVDIRGELDSSVDELMRIRRYLLSQGTFVTRGQTKLTVDDLWWDWLWLRGYGYPLDLTELHLQKVQAISKTAQARWRERLRLYALSTALGALRQATPPVLGREKAATISLRLTNLALDLAGPTAPSALQKELKLYLYRGLQANGQTYEASQVKKEIAMDLFMAKGWQIVKSPAEPWSRGDLGFFGKVFASLGQLFRSLFTFLTYGAGFLFVATPIDVLLIAAAIFILGRQGKAHFNVQIRGLSPIWKEHRLIERDGWRRALPFLKDALQYLREELSIAWRMFVASYTATPVPFYSKIAASLLLFGVGLYFNSARMMVETVVAQMTM